MMSTAITNTSAAGGGAEMKKRIMRRVYGVWFWKHVAPVLAVEFILLAGVAVGVFTHISVRNILVNALEASADARAFIQFFINNFFVKSIQSQLLVFAYAAIAVFFARDLRRAWKRLGSSDEQAFATILG